MTAYDVHYHVRPNGGCPFTEYMETLRRYGSTRDVERINAAVDDLREYGSQRSVRLRRAEKMNDVWQIRSGSHRVFYFWDRSSQRYILLQGYRKQSSRTPRRELQRAERLMREYYRSVL